MGEASVRHMIDDVPAAVRFYTTVLGFALEQDASPAFAAVVRDGVRLLLSGEAVPASGRSPTAASRYQAAGIVFISRSAISKRRWRSYARPACHSERMTS